MIEYKGTPLFGEGSSVSHTSEFFAIAGTVLFWLLFLIFSFVIKPQPKKKYKEVQIVLSSTPVVQKTEEASAPSEAASASAASAQSEPAQTQPVVESPAPAPKAEPVQKTVETPKPKTQTQPKKEPAKTQPQSKPSSAAKPAPAPQQTMSEPIEYATDLSGGVDFNKIAKKTPVDNSIFDSMDSDDNNFSDNDSSSRKVKEQSSMDGIGGTLSANKNEGLTSENLQGPKTEEARHGAEIGKVRDTKEIGTSESGAGKSSEKSAGKDKNSVVWTDGAGARTYYSLDTSLSDKAIKSMQVSKATPFTITFSVDADGNVMITTIEIKNEFILSEIIKKEMKEKIGSWKFGKGSGISKAQFDWVLSPGN